MAEAVTIQGGMDRLIEELVARTKESNKRFVIFCLFESISSSSSCCCCCWCCCRGRPHICSCSNITVDVLCAIGSSVLYSGVAIQQIQRPISALSRPDI